MSYASGFMLGASIGKAIHGMFCKNDIPASAYQDAKIPKVQPQITAPLSMGEMAIPAFTCVSAIKGRRRYRAAALVGNRALAEMLQSKIASLKAIQTVQVNAVTGSILLCAKNEGIMDKLEVFLRSRVFTENENQQREALIMRGMRKMIMLNQRPSGPQMLWWAAALMRGGR